jgi:hypothetical protein
MTFPSSNGVFLTEEDAAQVAALRAQTTMPDLPVSAQLPPDLSRDACVLLDQYEAFYHGDREQIKALAGAARGMSKEAKFKVGDEVEYFRSHICYTGIVQEDLGVLRGAGRRYRITTSPHTPVRQPDFSFDVAERFLCEVQK